MTDRSKFPLPGPVALFGSGEAAPSGQKIFDFIFKQMPLSPKVSILETPAGFELNSEQVAGNVADFIRNRLKNYKPDIQIIPARKKGTEYSPDKEDIVLPILDSDLIFMGPGSPTYAVRQLNNSLAWEFLISRHRLGAGLALSSATTVAISSHALPVYEIYKVGQDIHWQDGLDLFSAYGLSVSFIPHWNNKDGGAGLDTSRCYMGESRFNELMELLPEEQSVIGIDEHTGLIIDFKDSCFHIVGSGNVTVIVNGHQQVYQKGCAVELSELGDFSFPDPRTGLIKENWKTAVEINERSKLKPNPPKELIQLAEKRQQAREDQDWESADKYRNRIEERGWSIMDTTDGYTLDKTL
jgi:hypothetical protein